MPDDYTYEGSPSGKDCPGDVCQPGAQLTPQSILSRLDTLLADSGGAYSSSAMPIEQAIRYSIIAAHKQTMDGLTVIVNVLASNVVARVQYAEEQLERIVRPKRTIIRARIKHQDQIIQSLIKQLGDCISARTGYSCAQLADVQAKMLAGDLAQPESPTAYPDTGIEYAPEESPSGPPSPAALGLKQPGVSATYGASGKPCTYIDWCRSDEISGWWSYGWAWAFWWWSWFRWYLRAAWACWASRCGLPARPYTAEGMAHVIAMEQSGQQIPAEYSAQAISTSSGMGAAANTMAQGQASGLYIAMVAAQVSEIMRAAQAPDPDDAMDRLFGTQHTEDFADPLVGLEVSPIEDEHYPIEEIPEE